MSQGEQRATLAFSRQPLLLLVVVVVFVDNIVTTCVPGLLAPHDDGRLLSEDSRLRKTIALCKYALCCIIIHTYVCSYIVRL